MIRRHENRLVSLSSHYLAGAALILLSGIAFLDGLVAYGSAMMHEQQTVFINIIQLEASIQMTLACILFGIGAGIALAGAFYARRS
jgi:hypothetical protein